MTTGRELAAGLIAVAAVVAPAVAQTPQGRPDTSGPRRRRPGGSQSASAEEKTEEEKPKTFWEENKLFAYTENSYTFNLTGSGRGGTNELRFYDNHEGYIYGAYDWTEKIRTAVRQEYFRDANGARTGIGAATDLWSTTATFQYKIWKGLVGRLEYRQMTRSTGCATRGRTSPPRGCSRGARAWTRSR